MTRAQRERIRTQQERAVSRAFRESVDDIRNNTRLADLEAAIASGNPQAALVAMGIVASAFEPLARHIEESFARGGGAAAIDIGRIPSAPSAEAPQVQFRFDVRNPRAERWVATRSSRWITEVVEEQRAVVRNRLTQGMTAGENPRRVALDIIGRVDPGTRRRVGGVVGLTSRQAEWVSKAREELRNLDPHYFTRSLRDRRFDTAVRRAIDNNQPLPASQIDSAMTQMQNRALRMRGETIARTEAVTALRAGQHEAISQALEESGLNPSTEARKTWSSAGSDGRTRDDHLSMDGQTVPVDQPFTAPDGSMMMFPGDPGMGASAEQTINCRCSEQIQADFLAKTVRMESF